MSVSRMRLLTLGLTAASLVAVGSLTGIGQTVRDRLQVNAAEPPAAAKPNSADQGKATDAGDGSVRVDAPGMQVTVDKEHGKVSVTAPHTDVHVDADKGRVQVRAPHVNLDIHW